MCNFFSWDINVCPNYSDIMKILLVSATREEGNFAGSAGGYFFGKDSRNNSE
jgi:hypothetical protein